MQLSSALTRETWTFLLLHTTKDIKSPEWTEEDITETLKSLKNGKCKDPMGLINEIFKPPTAGSDMIQSLLLMMKNVSAIH